MRSSLLLLDLAAAASLFAGTAFASTATFNNNDHNSNIGSPLLVERAPPSCTNIPKTPPPQGLVCGKQGTVKNPKAIRTFNTNSDNCVETCLSTAACISFSYGPGRKCTLYSTNIYGSGFKAGPTGVTWSNRRCYARFCMCPTGLTNCAGNCVNTGTDQNNCGRCGTMCTGATNRCIQSVCTDPTPVCSQVPVIAENQELVRNGDFEDANDAAGFEAPPWTAVSGTTSYGGPAGSGIRSLNMFMHYPEIQAGAVQPILSAVKGRQYTLSFQLRLNEYTDYYQSLPDEPPKPCTFMVNWGDDPTLFSQVLDMPVIQPQSFKPYQVDNITCPTLNGNGNADFAILFTCPNFKELDDARITVDNVSLKGPTVSYTESCSTPGVAAPTARP